MEFLHIYMYCASIYGTPFNNNKNINTKMQHYVKHMF